MMLVGARAAEERRGARRDVLRRQLDSARSTSSSPCVSGRSKADSGATADFGTSRNSASMSATPIFASMARRSSGVSGR